MPTFVEIKGATYSGTTTNTKMTMKDIPWFKELKLFSEELNKLLIPLGYDLACEHEHVITKLFLKFL